MSCPAWISAARLAAAKSGVPMKARRRRLTAPPSLHGGEGGFLRLHQLAQDDVALESRQMVDEQDAVQMIHLMLDAGGERSFGRELPDLVLMVEIAHPDPGRADDVGVVLGQR